MSAHHAASLAKPALELSNGVSMPQLGLGVWQTPVGAICEHAVEFAIESGYRHIDTAAIYKNEESVGAGMKKAMAKLGLKREDLFLTTKLWNDDHGFDETLKAFETSLKKLDTPYVDLYLIHWPRGDKHLAQHGKKYLDSWRAMEKLYNEKKIRAIGLSNFSEKHINDILAVCHVRPMVDQVELHPINQQVGLRKFCEAQNIKVTCWSPLGQGKLLEDPTIAHIAATHKRTPAQIILRWELQQGLITIPKSTHENRIKENANVFDFELKESEMATINGMNRDERYGPVPEDAEF